MTVTCALPHSTSVNSSSGSAPVSGPNPTRMGRRKQHCPQKTGISADSDNINSNSAPTKEEEAIGEEDINIAVEKNGQSDAKDHELNSDSVSENSDKEVNNTPTMEAMDTQLNSNGLESKSQEDILASMLKSNPLLNPALLSLNPSSLYAMQLAQLQAAISQNATTMQLPPSPTPKAKEDNELNQRKRKITLTDDDESHTGSSVLNLSKKSSSSPKIRADSPLDLSGPTRLSPKAPKLAASVMSDDKLGLQSWAAAAAAAAGSFPFLNPFLSQDALTRFPGAAGGLLAAAAAARITPTSSSPATSSVASPTPSSAEKNPLERMSEIAKTGGRGGNGSSGPRHSAWQSQWINRGPEANKDIFQCLWCKIKFPNMQALTQHIKETKHYGSSISPSQSQQMPTNRHSSPMHAASKPPTQAPPSSSASANSSKPRDILKEQLPMPRKLVRGQDVWLGRGEQQTKDILKCIGCGESFRTLELLTKHMQETDHYKNVISQEQLLSWKSSDTQTGSSQNHVNAVFTCKVCEQPFSTFKELSDHMGKNNHYKESMGNRPNLGGLSMGGAPLGSTPPSRMSAMGRGSGDLGATKEKRKKSLPVRKLLELERAQQELSGQLKIPSDESTGKISCEKCGEKILTIQFVDHIRQCVGPLPVSSPRSDISQRASVAANTLASNNSSRRTPSVSPPRSDIAAPSKGSSSQINEDSAKEEPKSILGSLEKMVQNNFGAKKKPGPESNLSILQRLGIDEGVDYSKPLVDPLAMFRPPSLGGASSSSQGAGGLFFPSGRGSGTRSNSECSSPDRFRPERPGSIKSESSVKSPIPIITALPPTHKDSSRDSKSPVEDEKIKVEEEAHDEVENGVQSVIKSEEVVNNLKEEKMETDEKPESDNQSRHSKSPIAVASPATSFCSPKRSSTPASSIRDDNRCSGDEEEESSDNKADNKKEKKKDHPLAALQMLCDKTEKTPKPPATVTTTASYGAASDPGAILAFSWACNQAIMGDSQLLKCPFCDTPFISKGAYRHHLSKMHFVKDGASPDPKLFSALSAKTPESSPTPSTTGSTGVSGSDAKEENAQSKFAKYSQLAKQLSCSTQP